MHSNSSKTLRQELLKQRKEFAASSAFAQIREKLISTIQGFLASEGKALSAIALYWPIQDELDIRAPLLSWASGDKGRRLALPYARPDKHLDFYEWRDGDSLMPSKHGVPEPIPNNESRPIVDPDCIFIPCVGWSSSSANGKTHYWRLGYGGGYFDRTLSVLRKKNPKLICIGIGFNWQELDDTQWSAQTHDEPLNMLLTESGLLS
ncbi:5-formyltetrahydrofolate cyclo-ligase [Polynucleobacter sp. MWH-UH23A]|uniref:5-formyltetrahydrofolate cyclo-ligase n=1 Tax=Polynucleobacter sp. MWH-UH23A TaxID=1855613 RepID=UPI0033651D3C